MDLNTINASKMTMFKNAVNRQADREIEELTAKIREQRYAAERIREENEAGEAMAALKAERSSLEALYRKELSRCDYNANKGVLEHRKELVEEFFGEIENDLKEFSESEKYADFLKDRIKKAERALGKNIVVLASAKDEKLVSSLTSHEVRPDNTIVLGGVCAFDEKNGLFCDFSLDKALEDEKAAFSDKKELMIN